MFLANVMIIKNTAITNELCIQVHSGDVCNPVTLHNVTVADNDGTGIFAKFVTDGCHVTFHNIHLSNNHWFGLQLLCLFTTTFIDNITDEYTNETGVYFSGDRVVYFHNHFCLIANNYSPSNGGGMWISSDSSVSSSNTINFINNIAEGTGGAIYGESRNVVNTALKELCTFFMDFQSSFQNNKGLVNGDNVYGGSYWKCNTVFMFCFLSAQKYFTKYIDCVYNPDLNGSLHLCLHTLHPIQWMCVYAVIIVIPSVTTNQLIDWFILVRQSLSY